MVAEDLENLKHGQRADLARDANLHVFTRQQAAELMQVSPRSVATDRYARLHEAEDCSTSRRAQAAPVLQQPGQTP
jgi:hypothetical protein